MAVRYGIATSLPPVPVGMPDKEAALLRPIYLAINSLAQNTSEVVGLVQYSQSELANVSQLSGLQVPPPNILYAKAVGSDLADGKLVNLYVSGGKIAARYADASDNTKPAHGIVDVNGGIPAGNFGRIILIRGLCVGLTGSTFGAYYWLSTNGDVQNTPPTAGGSIRQSVGFGLNTGGFYLSISSQIIQN